MAEMSRREFVGVAAVGAAGVLAPGVAMAVPGDRPKRALRIAHLTDIHVQPERGAPEGMEKCLDHVQGQKDRPDLVFTGGDLIMDAFGADKARTQAQWDVFQRVLNASLELPVEHTIGNHDVFGWGQGDTFAADHGYGKKWACDVLGVARPYRSFDRSGWHFVVLDSTFREGNGYKARLDDAQFEWLEGDLAATPRSTPVMVVSHIPILGVSPYFDGDNEKSGNWQVPGAWMHIDARKIKDLFRKHPNVKLCLSGHIHLIDMALYNGVAYFCNGAVSAGWWGGDYQECTYGYGLADLHEDGTFACEYVRYGWKTRA